MSRLTFVSHARAAKSETNRWGRGGELSRANFLADSPLAHEPRRRLRESTNNYQDCVTRLRVQALTLPYKACAGHCYVVKANVRLRIREHLQQISCSEIWHLH